MIRPLAWASAMTLAAGMIGCGSEDLPRSEQQAREGRRLELNGDRDVSRIRTEEHQPLGEIDKSASAKAAEKPQRRDERATATPSQGVVAGALLKNPMASIRSDLRVRDAQGSEQILKTDRATHVTRRGRDVQLNDLPEGTEVRASFETDSHQNRVARDVQVLMPAR